MAAACSTCLVDILPAESIARPCLCTQPLHIACLDSWVAQFPTNNKPRCTTCNTIYTSIPKMREVQGANVAELADGVAWGIRRLFHLLVLYYVFPWFLSLVWGIESSSSSPLLSTTQPWIWIGIRLWFSAEMADATVSYTELLFDSAFFVGMDYVPDSIELRNRVRYFEYWRHHIPSQVSWWLAPCRSFVIGWIVWILFMGTNLVLCDLGMDVTPNFVLMTELYGLVHLLCARTEASLPLLRFVWTHSILTPMWLMSTWKFYRSLLPSSPLSHVWILATVLDGVLPLLVPRSTPNIPYVDRFGSTRYLTRWGVECFSQWMSWRVIKWQWTHTLIPGMEWFVPSLWLDVLWIVAIMCVCMLKEHYHPSSVSHHTTKPLLSWLVEKTSIVHLFLLSVHSSPPLIMILGLVALYRSADLTWWRHQTYSLEYPRLHLPPVELKHVMTTMALYVYSCWLWNDRVTSLYSCLAYIWVMYQVVISVPSIWIVAVFGIPPSLHTLIGGIIALLLGKIRYQTWKRTTEQVGWIVLDYVAGKEAKLPSPLPSPPVIA